MRRPPIIAILTAGACALGLAAPVAAQTPAPSSAKAAGLRYLSWPGRVYRPAPAAPSAEVADAAALTPTPTLNPTPTASGRPPIIPHGGLPAPASTASAAPREGLTPASAWIGSQAPAYAPQPAPMVAPPAAQPAPAPVAALAPVGAPWSRAVAATPAPMASPPSGYFAETAEAAPPPPPRPVMAAPRPAPIPAARPAPQPVRAPAPTPATPPAAPVLEAPAPAAAIPVPADAPADAAPAAPVADPMAPRRDAPIFRLQRPAPSAEPQTQPQAQPQTQAQAAAQPAPAVAAPGEQGGARYYSVHRQAGRQPDATPLPAPVYLDALPVELTSTPASTDLAEPPAAPNLIRNANGRLQALPANEDPVLP